VDPAAKKQMIDSFLKKYPDTGLTPLAHREASVLGMQTNNFEMMRDHGEKFLQAKPDDYAIMTELGRAYGERGGIDRAEEMAEQAVDLISAAEKPPQVTAEQWEQGKKMLLATNFSTLGNVHIRRAQANQDPQGRKALAERALAPFKKALEILPRDDISHWRIGLAYIFLNDYANAESHLAKAATINGVASDFARRDLEEIYKKEHKDSLEGLDKVLAKAKSDLALP
jgi:tetratricopeptide (TPR) repeat protein